VQLCRYSSSIVFHCIVSFGFGAEWFERRTRLSTGHVRSSARSPFT